MSCEKIQTDNVSLTETEVFMLAHNNFRNDFSLIEKKWGKIRYKYLLKGSKSFGLGIILQGLFPTAYANLFVYILLLSGIIPNFEINIYSHFSFALSLIFLTIYSFFNEVIYNSHEEMNLIVFFSSLGNILAYFFAMNYPF